MPYQADYYRNPYAGVIGDLIGANSRELAQTRRLDALARNQMLGSIGQAVSGVAGDYVSIKQAQAHAAAQQAAAQQQWADEAPEREHRELVNKDLRGRLSAGEQQAEQDARLRTYLEQNPTPTFNGVAAIVGPERAAPVIAAWEKSQPQKKAPIRVGQHETLLDPDTNEPIYTPPTQPEKVTFGAPQPQMVAGKRVLVRPGSDGRIYDMNLKPVDAGQIAPEPVREPQAPREPHLWVMRDGKQIRVAESQILPGDTPSNTREQGRPVTSGDAGRIADFDTSLDDLSTLAGTLSGNKATGTEAKVGALLPNFVTEATGWGTEAKQKQAVIDRVKQVIGKALEGGVLRKEDEVKYEKILPTISDTAPVVASKLRGLQQAITQRRQTMLEALEDANYDVSKFKARGAEPANAPASSGVPSYQDYLRSKGGK